MIDRTGEPYSVGEICLLSDRRRSNEEIAVLCNRKLAAVAQKRRKLLGPRYQKPKMDRRKWNAKTLPIVHDPDLSISAKAAILNVSEKSVERAAIFSSQDAVKWRALAQLSKSVETDKQAIDEMILGQKMSDKQLSEVLDMSISAIRKRRQRLKKRANDIRNG